MPKAVRAIKGLEQQIRTQDAVAQQLRARRREQGALEFQTFQPKAVFDGDKVVAIRQQVQNRGRQLIEEFMIATNGVTAKFLASKKRASVRRVVKDPEKWARIVDVAAEHGEKLPPNPDALALEHFLAQQRRLDPLRFPDLSLTIIKLMGSGEYVVEIPGGPKIGHFGLAVKDYTHSTAPNRRFPDMITQRLLKAALRNERAPYSHAELAMLAAHATTQEDMANKVERQARKSEAALLLQDRIGEVFEGVVTGIAKGSTWVRIFEPPAEGKLLTRRALRVGTRVSVRLQSTRVERGFIDFEER
jgi:exoribonuclease-2